MPVENGAEEDAAPEPLSRQLIDVSSAMHWAMTRPSSMSSTPNCVVALWHCRCASSSARLLFIGNFNRCGCCVISCYRFLQNVKLRKNRNCAGGAPVHSDIMVDEADFLRNAAARLRELAILNPEIAEQLRELADQLEARANLLDGGATRH